MKTAQQWTFWFGIVAFVVSVVFMGGWIGDTLWRAGVAAMLVVVAMRAVWPGAWAVAPGKGSGA